MPRSLWALCLLVVLSGCSSVKEGLKPVELTDFDEQTQFLKVWSKTVGEGQDARYARLQPLLYKDVLYVVDVVGQVQAINADTGKRLWKAALDVTVGGGVGMAQDTLLIGTLSGEVIALNLADGTEKWRTQLSSEVLCAPEGNTDRVIVQTIDARVFGLNLQDGKIEWSYDHTAPILTVRAQAAPVIVDDVAYIAFDNGQLQAFSVANGQLRWTARIGQPKGKTDIERLVDSDTSPLVKGPFVYGAGFQSRVVAINRGSGRLNWAQDVSTYHPIVEANGKIIVVDEESHLHAFDAATGAVSWVSDVLHRRALGAPGVLGGRVVVTDFEGVMHAFDIETGTLMARKRADVAKVVAMPITHNNTLYILDTKGVLRAVRFADVEPEVNEEGDTSSTPKANRRRSKIGHHKR